MLSPRHLIQPAVRYPADPRAVFILALSIFGGIGALAAQAGPGTLESVLPRWGVMLWGFTLLAGSIIALAGLARDSDNGIIAEQIGSVMVGTACIYYSVLALAVVGISAAQPMVVVMAWGLACLMRWLQLQLLIRENVKARLEYHVQQQVIKSITPPTED